MPKLTPTFWRALHSLGHPASLFAIVLLLFNDHWLRYHHPSWLSGKLGDFAWLVFAPFIAALFFALLPPLGQSARRVGVVSFVFIGLWFALAKTTPLVHHLTTETLYAIVGWRGTLRMDATDLLTLPALLIGWRIWRHSADTALALRPLAYIAFGLGIWGTLASDSYYYYDSGISEICASQDALYIALADYEPNTDTYDWVSYDGGLTWSPIERLREEVNATCSDKASVSDPQNPSIQYRWVPNERIERSADGGQTWLTDYPLDYLQQDVRPYLYYRLYDQDFDGRNVELIPAPLGAIADAQTGNLLFAMGWYGVLVRQPSGHYQWVGTDLYNIQNLLGPEPLVNALFYELWLAAMLPFLIITTSAAYMRHSGLLRRLWLVVGWVGWFALAVAFLPADKSDLTGVISSDFYWIGFISIILLFFVALPLSIGAVVDITRNFSQVWQPLLVCGVGTGLLYLAPLLAWSQGRIPRYGTANAFALLLAACGIWASWRYLRLRLPKTPNPKKKKTSPPDVHHQPALEDADGA